MLLKNLCLRDYHVNSLTLEWIITARAAAAAMSLSSIHPSRIELFFFLIIVTHLMNHIFEGLNMPQNSQIFPYTLGLLKNVIQYFKVYTHDYSYASAAPLRSFNVSFFQVLS